MSHWSKTNESGSVLGMKFVLFIYSLLGEKFLNGILFFVALYYYCMSKRTRNFSRLYADNYKEYCKRQGVEPKKTSSFWHIYNFAKMMTDKLAAWRGDIQMSDLDFPEDDDFVAMARRKEGIIVMSSHFGNIEICRAFSAAHPDVTINILAFNEHAQKFNEVLNQVNGLSKTNMISVDNMGPEVGALLKQKLEDGEWVFLMGDRTSVEFPGRSLEAEFLGKKAKFPQGVFVLATILGSPVHSMHVYRRNDCFVVKTKLLSGEITGKVKRQERDAKIRSLLQAYIKELEAVVMDAPLQWFNFFNFWKS